MSMDPLELNIDGVRQLVGSGLNKSPYKPVDNGEGVVGDFEDVLSLSLPDEKLIAMANKWEADYRNYEGKMKYRWETNKKFYEGRQNDGYSTRDQVVPSNILFQAQETFIAAAMAKNPDPVVYADNTQIGQAMSKSIKTMLQFHAERLQMRYMLSGLVRDWSIYFIACIKFGWDSEIEDVKMEVIKPDNLIFNPKGYIDIYGRYCGGPLGERKKCTAEDLIAKFGHKEYITVMVEGNMGTEVTYTEWSTDEYKFFTFKNIVLDKYKNPFWNYDEQTVESTDEEGNKTEIPDPLAGKNHFAKPLMNYVFLSVFSLQETPHDITNLIEQNIPNQMLINKRIAQIDKNLDTGNNSIVFSDTHFTTETAHQAAMAMQAGRPILAKGDIRGAVERFPAEGLPSNAYEQLQYMTESLMGVFGTTGITAQSGDENTTARGMILNNQYDSSRIGGTIGDALERVAKGCFNWLTQLYFVFYDEPHYASVMGKGAAVEYTLLRAQDISQQFIVSVQSDSMKPKDEITEMNQANALWESQAIDPVTYFTMLNLPDPVEAAAKAVMWKLNPQQYQATYLNQQPTQPTQNPQGGGQQPPQVQGEQPGTTGPSPDSSSLSNVPINQGVAMPT